MSDRKELKDPSSIPTPAPLEAAEAYSLRVYQWLAESIGEAMPDGWCFCLILATVGDENSEHPQRMTYISNANRENMIEMLREMADKQERREPEL